MPNAPAYGNITIGSIPNPNAPYLRDNILWNSSVPSDLDDSEVSMAEEAWDVRAPEPEASLPVFSPVRSDIPYLGVSTQHRDRPTFEEQFMQTQAPVVSPPNYSHTLDFSTTLSQFLPLRSEVPRMIRTARDWMNRDYPEMTDNSLGIICRHIKFKFDHGVRGRGSDGNPYYRFTISCRGCGLYWNTNEPTSRTNPLYAAEVERQEQRARERDAQLRQIMEDERQARDAIRDELRVRDVPLWDTTASFAGGTGGALDDSYIRMATRTPSFRPTPEPRPEPSELYDDYVRRILREQESPSVPNTVTFTIR